jgi:hypothetical protein
MNQSNKLCTELLATYRDFEPLNAKRIVGYKLVEKKNLNYYSIVTGMFRYKPGSVAKSSYSNLYKHEAEHLVEQHLIDRLAIFTTPEDARAALNEYERLTGAENIVLLEIELSGNLETAVYTNQYASNLPVYIGSVMENIKEIK